MCQQASLLKRALHLSGLPTAEVIYQQSFRPGFCFLQLYLKLSPNIAKQREVSEVKGYRVTLNRVSLQERSYALTVCRAHVSKS